jgi:chromate transporter
VRPAMNQHPTDPIHAAADSVSPPPLSTLQEIAQTFLSLGLTAFGGPAAHIAMMETELVRRRQWLSREHYLDLIGLASLVPGPNSTEVAIHLGRVRGGWRGLLIAGICFILPAMILVWGLAIAYVQFQTVPVLQGLLYGVKPVVLAIIVLAFWKLMRTAIKDYWLGGLAVAVALANWFGISELLLLVLGGLAYLGIRIGIPPTLGASAGFLLPTLGTVVPTPAQWQVWQVFLYFLKIGSVLYGSGYVLLAFLQNDLVEKLKLLSSQELLDAVAIGQVTPGPVFTTATFIGYLLAGHAGAIAGTIGIFLPAFIFVALTQFGIERLRNVQGFRFFLDGVNAAALALMAIVSVKLGIAAFIDPLTIGLGLLSFGLLQWQPKLNSAWLVLGGAVVGIIAQLGFQR